MKSLQEHLAALIERTNERMKLGIFNRFKIDTEFKDKQHPVGGYVSDSFLHLRRIKSLGLRIRITDFYEGDWEGIDEKLIEHIKKRLEERITEGWYYKPYYDGNRSETADALLELGSINKAQCEAIKEDIRLFDDDQVYLLNAKALNKMLNNLEKEKVKELYK